MRWRDPGPSTTMPGLDGGRPARLRATRWTNRRSRALGSGFEGHRASAGRWLGHPVDQPRPGPVLAGPRGAQTGTEPAPDAGWATRWTNRRSRCARCGVRRAPSPRRTLVGPPGGPTDDRGPSVRGPTGTEPAPDAGWATRWTNRRARWAGEGTEPAPDAGWATRWTNRRSRSAGARLSRDAVARLPA